MTALRCLPFLFQISGASIVVLILHPIGCSQFLDRDKFLIVNIFHPKLCWGDLFVQNPTGFSHLPWIHIVTTPLSFLLLHTVIKMNKYLLVGFSLLLLCTIAQGLVCNVCKYKIGSLCLKSDEPCQASEGQYCETTRVYMGAMLLYKKHGCGKFYELCEKREKRDSAFNVTYIRNCCNTDLCNH